MQTLTQVLERADEVMSKPEEISKIELPALKEVMEQVAITKSGEFGHSKYTDHSKSSTKGCAMGCLGG
jgi:hypothetical protein